MSETRCYSQDMVDQYLENKLNEIKKISFDTSMYTHMLETQDRIQCCNRYEWDLPKSPISSLQIESILYDDATLCGFFDDDEIFHIAKYVTHGSLLEIGKMKDIQPITLDGKAWGPRRQIYNGNMDFTEVKNPAFICFDYTSNIVADYLVSRHAINLNTTIKDQTNVYKVLLYDIILSLKKLTAKCKNADQVSRIQKDLMKVLDPSFPILSIVGGSDVTDQIELMSFVNKINVEDLTQAVDFYYKIRRGFNGISTPDILGKRERLITNEVENANIHPQLVLYDGYLQRKTFCENIKKYYNYDIDVRISPILLNNEDNNIENE